MNQRIMRNVPGGKVYDTVYSADASQNSQARTTDVSMQCPVLAMSR